MHVETEGTVLFLFDCFFLGLVARQLYSLTVLGILTLYTHCKLAIPHMLTNKQSG